MKRKVVEQRGEGSNKGFYFDKLRVSDSEVEEVKFEGYKEGKFRFAGGEGEKDMIIQGKVLLEIWTEV